MIKALTFGLAGLLAAGVAQAKTDAKAMVATAVATELRSDHDDHTAYVYRDHDVTPEHDTTFLVVETPAGSLKKKLEDHGRPLSAVEQTQDDARVKAFMADASAQAKAKKDSDHDDEQAEQMLKLLPVAFLWTVKSENAETATLAFKPDPEFKPENMEARVLADMAGEIVIARGQERIQTIKGALVDDVKIGYGILGRLKSGGTFQVERREVLPHHWQVTETHVHIQGHVFFKTIGSQEDETRSVFRQSTAQTLDQAYGLLSKGGL